MVNRMAKLALSSASVLAVLLISGLAFAANGNADNEFTLKSYLAIAAGFGIGIAAFGGALGQARAAAAALEGIARNPNAKGEIMTPLLLSLALIESLVIYAFVVALLLQGKIGG